MRRRHAHLLAAAEYDGASVEPSIFGTLFERSLDPSKRSQLGAHYTSQKDIETLVAQAVRANIRAAAEHLRHGSQLVEQLEREGGLAIVGAEYCLQTGVVDFFDGVAES